MVRVRVLFLEPGNKIHPSSLDTCLTDAMLVDNGASEWNPEVYEEEGFFMLSKNDLADSLHTGQLMMDMVSSPNDPIVEMLKPLTVLYFDLLEINSDWESGSGAIGYALENISLYDKFGDLIEKFIKYAEPLKQRRNAFKDEWGLKVQFLTMWHCWTSQDYFGEWDAGEDFMGVIQHSEMKVRPLLPPPPLCPNALDFLDGPIEPPTNKDGREIVDKD